ncbi:hypothetical protein D9M71_515500 [compost metagenome]
MAQSSGEFQLYVGIQRGKARQQPGQLSGHQVFGDPQTQKIDGRLLTDFTQERVEMHHQLARSYQQTLPVRGQSKRATAALEHPVTEYCFQPDDLLAHRRLRTGYHLGCRSKTAGLRHRDKRPKQVDFKVAGLHAEFAFLLGAIRFMRLFSELQTSTINGLTQRGVEDDRQ